MSEHLVTSANDVELILEGSSRTRGTQRELGRIVVDEFTITREEDDSLVSGVGFSLPAGISNGDVTHNFSFTMMGQDVDTFEMVATRNGRSNVFSFTARKTRPIEGVDDVELEWEFSLETCKATSEELTASTGDTMEYAVEGIAVSVDKRGLRSDGDVAWGTENNAVLEQ